MTDANQKGKASAGLKDASYPREMQPLDRMARLLDERGLQCALIFSPANITYFTGFEAPIESGPAPFALHPAALLLNRAKPPELLLADLERLAFPPDSFRVTAFSAYTVNRPLPGLDNLIELLLERLLDFPKATLGVEFAETPAAVIRTLQRQFPDLVLTDISAYLASLRVVKTSQEIELIRGAVSLAEIGQLAAKTFARPGISEIELFAEIHKAMEISAGIRVPVLPDILSGPRSAEGGGPPTGRLLQAGDTVLIDLAPRFRGYWGDSCSAFVVGPASIQQRDCISAIEDVLAGALSMLKPGLPVCELYEWMHREAARFGPAFEHHAGHGLGVSWHEEPRITPYNNMILEPGMVIALEPGVYFGGEMGIRKEAVASITETGADILTETL